jgi:hypothetical protein
MLGTIAHLGVLRLFARVKFGAQSKHACSRSRAPSKTKLDWQVVGALPCCFWLGKPHCEHTYMRSYIYINTSTSPWWELQIKASNSFKKKKLALDHRNTHRRQKLKASLIDRLDHHLIAHGWFACFGSAKAVDDSGRPAGAGSHDPEPAAGMVAAAKHFSSAHCVKFGW